jgi:hypothetical protein
LRKLVKGSREETQDFSKVTGLSLFHQRTEEKIGQIVVLPMEMKLIASLVWRSLAVLDIAKVHSLEVVSIDPQAEAPFEAE